MLLSADQRFILRMNRRGHETVIGGCLEIKIAWLKLIREIKRELKLI